MQRDAAAEVPNEEQTIARLMWALRTLEERRRAGLAPPANVISFLGALDRRLTDEELRYVAMVFAACRETREELTAVLVERLGIPRGGVIAGIRAHLEQTMTRTIGVAPREVCEYLDRLRHAVLLKAAQFA